jgi:uncharacterized protein YegP (UPF0339 family)
LTSSSEFRLWYHNAVKVSYSFNTQFVASDIMPESVFEWYCDKAGKFRFRLKAANGEIIAVSEGYTSKEGCVNGIESVKKNAPIAKIVEAKE